MAINIQNKNLVFTVLLSSIVIGGAKIINDNKNKKKRLGEMSAKFDQQDRDFSTEERMKMAFRQRNKGKELSSQDVLAAFHNMRKQSDF